MLCVSEHRWSVADDMSLGQLCPRCKAPTARPDIVWFGEMPYGMDHIELALSEADLFAAIGTSGNVYPAAGFVQMAKAYGAHTVELNLEPSAVVSQFDETRFGKASGTVPVWVADVLKG